MESVAGTKPKRLLGRDDATIDDKGRVLFSKKKRERLGSGFVICLGDNGCLYAYPQDVWEPLVEEVLSYDPTNQGRQAYTRLVLGSAEDEIDFDAQGRAVIPRKLREAANLKEKIVLIGCGDRLEIWSTDELQRHDEDPENYGKVRASMIKRAWREMRESGVAA